MLGGELAAGAAGDDVALEIGFAAEQPEAVPDLPFDRHAGVGRRAPRRGADWAAARGTAGADQQMQARRAAGAARRDAAHVDPGADAPL